MDIVSVFVGGMLDRRINTKDFHCCHGHTEPDFEVDLIPVEGHNHVFPLKRPKHVPN